MNKYISISAIILVTALHNSIASEIIYKSIDESGDVTYSATPPEESHDTIPIELDSTLSDDRMEEARQVHERNRKAAQILDENRKMREQIIAETNRLKYENQRQYRSWTTPQGGFVDRENYSYPYYPAYWGRPSYRPSYSPGHSHGLRPGYGYRPGHRQGYRYDYRPEYRPEYRQSPGRTSALPLPETSFRIPGR
jgi:hypothetical protein